jgi:hypothetical protein
MKVLCEHAGGMWARIQLTLVVVQLGKRPVLGPNRGPILDWKEVWLRPRNEEVVLAWEGEGVEARFPGTDTIGEMTFNPCHIPA